MDGLSGIGMAIVKPQHSLRRLTVLPIADGTVIYGTGDVLILPEMTKPNEADGT